MSNRVREIARRIRARLHLGGPRVDAGVDYLDAPVMTAVSAEIPVGETFVFAPSYVSRRETDEVREIPLGPAEVRGDTGWIFQNGIWLMAFSWYGGQSFLPSSYVLGPRRTGAFLDGTSALEGRTISTLGDFQNVYGHVLLDELPKLLYLIDSGRFRGYETILSSPLALRLLSRIADPRVPELRVRIKTADCRLRYCCADFVALQRTGCRMNPSPQEIELLRRYGLGTSHPAENYPPALFLERASQTRTIENADAVRKVLDRFGIAVRSPTAFENPWQAFAAAQLIVGVSGSDLADSVFMTPGTTLLEIHPSDHIKPYYWNITRKLGVRYHSLIAESKVLRKSVTGPGTSPIMIDTEQLAKALSALL